MKVVFFGTSNVALPVLEILHAHHEVVGVVTQPDAAVGRSKEMSETPVALLAKELNLPIFKPQTVKGNDVFRMELQDLLADVFVVVSYGKILPAEIINLPRLQTLNVHFSLLPSYRGASPIQYALLSGDTATGTTIFVLDERMDTGPIVAAKEFPIDADDNFITLSQRLAYASAELLHQTLPAFASGAIVPMPQDESQATYTKIITKSDGKVNWQKSAQEIYNQFRAFYPWPGIWTVWNGKMVKILDCVPSSQAATGETVGGVLSDGTIACGNGSALKINKLQLEGKNETDIRSFMNGYPQFVGSTLGT